MIPTPTHPRIGTPYGKAGSWSGGRHGGVDFPCPPGTPVVAPWSGTVKESGRTSWGTAYGTAVLIDFDRLPNGDPGLWGILAHLTHADVGPGDRVTAGQTVGRSGATGNVTGPHVHFEVQRGPRWASGAHTNPQPWLNAHPTQQQEAPMSDEYGLDDPNTRLVVGRSYVRFSTNWNPRTSGLQHGKRYSKVRPHFKTGASGGALRFRCVRTGGGEPDDPTWYHDEGVTADMLDADGFFLRSFASFESGDASRDLHWEVKCIGGMESATIEPTRYAGFAVQD
jgi:hypothetical protein